MAQWYELKVRGRSRYGRGGHESHLDPEPRDRGNGEGPGLPRGPQARADTMGEAWPHQGLQWGPPPRSCATTWWRRTFPRTLRTTSMATASASLQRRVVEGAHDSPAPLGSHTGSSWRMPRQPHRSAGLSRSTHCAPVYRLWGVAYTYIAVRRYKKCQRLDNIRN